MGKLRRTQMVQAFLTSHHPVQPGTREQSSLVDQEPSISLPNHPRAPSIRSVFRSKPSCPQLLMADLLPSKDR